MPVKTEGWGNAEFLSGGRWRHVAVEEGAVEKDVPAEGVLIRYSFIGVQLLGQAARRQRLLEQI